MAKMPLAKWFAQRTLAQYVCILVFVPRQLGVREESKHGCWPPPKQPLHSYLMSRSVPSAAHLRRPKTSLCLAQSPFLRRHEALQANDSPTILARQELGGKSKSVWALIFSCEECIVFWPHDSFCLANGGGPGCN